MRAPLLALGAALAAAAWPLETFLLAFCVLGPAHYLTELEWLAERRFFTTAAAARGLGALSLLGAALATALEAGVVPDSSRWPAQVVALAVLGAALGVLVRPERPLLPAALSASGVVVLAGTSWAKAVFVLLGVLLPTVLHVAGGTLLFLLSGSLRRGDLGDRVALVVMLGASAWLLASPSPVVASAEVTQRYQEGFGWLDAQLAELTGLARPALVRWLAFAYTWHFLNWFGKLGTTWRPRRWPLLLGGWALAVTLYAVNPTWGFWFVAWPNLAHVLLELPLNLRTARGLVGRSPGLVG